MEGLVIHRITRGSTLFTVYGETLPAAKNNCARNYYVGASHWVLHHALPKGVYITQSVYNMLTASERDEIRPNVIGIVPDAYSEKGTNPNYPYDETWVFSVTHSSPMSSSNPPVAPPVDDTPTIPPHTDDPYIPSNGGDGTTPLPVVEVGDGRAPLIAPIMLAVVGVAIMYILSRRKI